MGEAFIVGRGGDSSSSGTPKLVTNIFTTNGVFVVPNARNQQFTVRIFGGGGGGGYSSVASNVSGGGGGFMNNAILTLQEGKAISVQIGSGGKGAIPSNPNSTTGATSNNGTKGGTTSFGTYLSAIGGLGGNSNWVGTGGDGGSGGGTSSNRGGGNGYQFGGGGGTGTYCQCGGKWGGGGGSSGTVYDYTSYYNDTLRGGCLYNSVDEFLNNRMNKVTGYSGLAGNGGDKNKKTAQNGTNTIGMNLDYTGKGLAGNDSGNSYGCGGGGYGGCGGIYSGGGGGYGANGGNYCGGGGGYGGRGGDYCGGGGGYGAGGDGYSSSLSSPSDGTYGGGGGGGANSTNGGNGGDGICIIQYYA